VRSEALVATVAGQAPPLPSQVSVDLFELPLDFLELLSPLLLFHRGNPVEVGAIKCLLEQVPLCRRRPIRIPDVPVADRKRLVASTTLASASVGDLRQANRHGCHGNTTSDLEDFHGHTVFRLHTETGTPSGKEQKSDG